MRIGLRTKILSSMLSVILISGLVTTIVGVRLIGQRIVRQAQEKVRTDLNSAREIYNELAKDVLNVTRFNASRTLVQSAVAKHDRPYLARTLARVLESEHLDILDVIGPDQKVIVRAQNPGRFGDPVTGNRIVERVMELRQPAVASRIAGRDELVDEDIGLAAQAVIKILPTPKAKFQRTGSETSGMMIAAAAPIFDEDQQLVGVMYGAKLINRNYDIVDKVKNTVFQDEQYKGKSTGTATIFQQDLRVSTNVMNLDQTRAIGTLVSREVYEAVIEKGVPWVARAFVVNAWYITAYEPIKDIDNNIIGILYVGILEQKFTDMRDNVILTFVGITILGIALVVAMSFILSAGIVSPVNRLASAARQIAKGDFASKVDIRTNDEIADLGEIFNFMARSIEERDAQIRQFAQAKIAEAERLAMIGQLAAGVAHEINNPLSAILLHSHMLLEKIPPDDPRRVGLDHIVKEAQRCRSIVKGLLDFARQSEPEVKPTALNQVIDEILALVKSQPSLLNVRITTRLDPNLPKVNADTSQLHQVFINIIMNGVEAMNGQGELVITTGPASDRKYVYASVKDTGCGIAPDHLSKIFTPFFTTKEPGHGTGLGLAISYGIIQKHGGRIEVSSQPGHGALFTVYLPAA